MQNMNVLKLMFSNLRAKNLLNTVILLVKDGKYVCEAMELVFLHSGERLRPLNTLAMVVGQILQRN